MASKALGLPGGNEACLGNCSSSNPPGSIVALDEAMGNYNDDVKHDDSSTLADTAEKMVEGANKENEIGLGLRVQTNSQDDSSSDESDEAEWKDKIGNRKDKTVDLT